MMVGRGKGMSRGRESQAGIVEPLPSAKNHDVIRNFYICQDSSVDFLLCGDTVTRYMCSLSVLINFYDGGLSNI
jgi:hypothetical protein